MDLASDSAARRLLGNDDRPTYDVLVQGRASVDLTFLGLTELPRLGEEYQATGFGISPGASFIETNAMARLGLRVGLVTDIGNGLFDRYVYDALRAAKIDQTFVRLHERPLMEVSAGISFPQDRTFITWDPERDWAGRRISVEDLRRQPVRCVFCKDPLAPEVYAETRRQGILFCSDAFWDAPYLASGRVQALIDQADVFLPNLSEALAITGAATPEGALAALRDRVGMLAITLGPHGVLGSKGGETYRVPPLPVAAIDTTGAGDNFNAGFLYGLVRDRPFVECLRCGVAAGSLSTRALGGVIASATEEELLEAVAALGAST